MKEYIEKNNLSIKKLAELYDIPYNTVRQWYNRERKCPKYILNLIKENKKIEENEFVYEYYKDNQIKYRAFLYKEKTEEQIEWFNRCQSKKKEEGLTTKIYKLINFYTEKPTK